LKAGYEARARARKEKEKEREEKKEEDERENDFKGWSKRLWEEHAVCLTLPLNRIRLS